MPISTSYFKFGSITADWDSDMYKAIFTASSIFLLILILPDFSNPSMVDITVRPGLYYYYSVVAAATSGGRVISPLPNLGDRTMELS